MSVDHQHSDDATEAHDTVLAGSPVEVRRNSGLSALVGAGASAIAIGYLWRMSQTGLVLDWALFAVMTLIAVFHLAALVDSRTPLLVADDLGVRIRLGDEWRGLPWDAVERVDVHPRRGLVRDGRIVFTPYSLARALDGLDAKGRRHATLNRRMYGAALAVPLGLTTRVSQDEERTLVDRLTTLARDRAEVVEVAEPAVDEPAVEEPAARSAEPVAPPETPSEPEHERLEETRPHEQPDTGGNQAAEVTATADDEEEPTEEPARRTLLGGIGTIVSRAAKGAQDAEQDPAPGAEHDSARGTAEAIPLRATRAGLRAEVTRDLPATAAEAGGEDAETDGRPATEGRELHRPGSVDLVFEKTGSDRVRPISQLGDPVEPLVIDDFVTEPAYDPVIGPELAAARTRLGLSVDELAVRTRIRPHVIESIEVDDFAPCGGDFYARGHLRTLARVLGKDVSPLLERFEDRYATAPVNARRVFEAELATGMTGSMRSTMGGPNWGLLIGAVLVLVLVWGVVRLFASEPAQLVQNSPLVGQAAVGTGGSAGSGHPGPVAAPLPLTLVAAHGTHVVVHDGEGAVVFRGRMAPGEKKRIEADRPVRVRAANAGAIEVMVAGEDRGDLGEVGHPGHRTFR